LRIVAVEDGGMRVRTVLPRRMDARTLVLPVIARVSRVTWQELVQSVGSLFNRLGAPPSASSRKALIAAVFAPSQSFSSITA
jgi:hypothetical protein